MTRRIRDAMPPEPHDEMTWRIVAWINDNWAWIVAGLVTMLMVLLRAYLDRVAITRKDVSEAIMCGVFVMSSRPVMLAVGINEDWAIFIGAIVGCLGAKFFRPILESVARGFISSKTGGRND